MELEIPQPDLTNPEGVRKSMADIFAAARALAKRGSELETQVATLSADLAVANRSMAEMTRIANAAPTTGPASELRSFVGDDGRLLVTGKATAEDGWTPGLLDAGPDYGPWHTGLKQLVEERNICRAVLSAKNPALAKTCTPKADRRLARHIALAPPELRKAAVDIGGQTKAFGDISGAGAEWYPDIMMPILERDYMQERRVAALFDVMPMTAKNVLLPFLSLGLRPYIKGAVAGDDPSQYTSSSITTAQRAINAIGFAVRTQLDEEAGEDSLIDAMGILRQELISALVDGEEDAIINGDSTASHGDTGLSGWDIGGRWGTSGLGGASDHRRAWIGLRHRAIDVSCTTDGGSAETFAGLMTARGAMDAPHGRARDLIVLTSLTYMIKKISQFAELVTLEKYGPNATIFAGEVGHLAGAPVVLSDFLDYKYNASGIYDNSTKTKSGIVQFNRKRFKIGMRRGSAVEIDKDITRGVFNLVSTSREIFFTFDSSTKKNVHWDYNHTGVS